ncbi:hypothetical protein COT72_01155 [archaeon CG10_big_fil_rev_8_21_14_0_10_43_11]|nr:MAG: hypothetical protein COT72_01155 [archaeon CG10_big_fil_rev_8_21_14_0_10_43_11]
MMREEELLKKLKNLLDECKELPFSEKLLFLARRAAKEADPEFRAVMYLYIDYVIKQKNEKKTVDFRLPPLRVIQQTAHKLERDEHLQNLLEGEQKPVIKKSREAGGLYTPQFTASDSHSGSFYAGPPSVKKGLYTEQYTPGDGLYERQTHEEYDSAPRGVEYDSSLEHIADEKHESAEKKREKNKEKLLY